MVFHGGWRQRGWALGAILAGLAIGQATPGTAKVVVSPIFGSHMVLQRDAVDPVWGTAAPGEKVAVLIDGQRVQTRADGQGKWIVKLAPLHSQGPFVLTIQGKNTIRLHDVLVGEVWLCSGQSNMQYPLYGWTAGGHRKATVARANYPWVRFFRVTSGAVMAPLANIQGKWQVCTPKTAAPFSAVAYYFARDLGRKLHEPVGVIGSYAGGTIIDGWMSMDSFKDPAFAPILRHWHNTINRIDKKWAAWTLARRQWNMHPRPAGAKRPSKAFHVWPPAHWAGWPAELYDGMIGPLIPFRIKGAIWYQGESDAFRAYQYRKLLPAMIRGWRRHWGEGKLPFLIVQLPNVNNAMPQPGACDWAELREAQMMACKSVSNTFPVVTIDVAPAKNANIHYWQKGPVGQRLAWAAEANVYGIKRPWCGPIYKAMQIQGQAIVLSFTHLGGGLIARGGGVLTGFAIAGKNKKFVWAKAVIRGDTVVVQSAKVAHPVAVRYAWDYNPKCNLINRHGLPASPFRTDDWPGITVKVDHP